MSVAPPGDESRSLANAICAPSGDQAGIVSTPELVSFVGVPPAAPTL
jgi:hypothetical protein